MIDYGYVTAEQMDECPSFAIVRDPYSRMVSIYMYNRFGPFETFPNFVRSWYKALRHYRQTGEMEEWYTHCHCIPQFEFCYVEGRQLVKSIVKQEELKYLKQKQTTDGHGDGSSVRDLPKVVRDALLGMPHDNKRKTNKPWYEYYDQETLDLTYEMYKDDFDVFGYSPTLSKRPDLEPPKTFLYQYQSTPTTELSECTMATSDTSCTLDTSVSFVSSASSSVLSRGSITSVLLNLTPIADTETTTTTTPTEAAPVVSTSPSRVRGEAGKDEGRGGGNVACRTTTVPVPPPRMTTMQCTFEKIQRDASASLCNSISRVERRTSFR